MLNKLYKTPVIFGVMVILAGCVTTKTPTATTPATTSLHTYTLNNGLKVILKQDHRSPIVMTQIWYKVGSNHETEHKGGLAHFLEHMMFKDNKVITGDDYHRLIAQLGGQKNAFTSHNYTAYYEQLPANQYPVALQIEAGRMNGLIINHRDVLTENQVVQEERRQRTDSNPLSQAIEKFNSQIFSKSPKANPVIGSMRDIQGLGIDDLKQFYQTYYTPNNATLVLVGDFDKTQAKAFIQEYFGDITKGKPVINQNSLTEPTHKGYQNNVFCGEVAKPTLIMGFNVPSLSTHKKDAYALSLLQDIADGGLSARFEKSLIRNQSLLNSVSISYNFLDKGDTTLSVYATPKDGVNLDTAQQAIMQEFNNITHTNIDDSELLRASNQLTASLVFANDSIDNQANLYGMLSSLDLPLDTIDNLPTTLNSITKKDIEMVRQKYLTKDNLTVMQVKNCQTANQQTSAQ